MYTTEAPKEHGGMEGSEGHPPCMGLSHLSTIYSRATPVTSCHQAIRNETASKPERFYSALKAKHNFQ